MNGRPFLTVSHSSRVPPPPCSTAFSRKSVDYTSQTLRPNAGPSDTICGSVRPQMELTVVVMGASMVGKSAMINQFLHRTFSQDYKETVDDMHWIEYDTTFRSSTFSTTYKEHKTKQDTNVNTGLFLLKIIDTSGSREFMGMRKLYEEQGDAFILVVAIDDGNSLEEAKFIRREIGERNQKNAPVIVVLNKIDLRNKSGEKLWRQFRIMAEETYEFASSTESLFAEASATKYETVTEIFQRLLQKHSSVPPTVGLKYRRKSVPNAAATLANFAPAKEMAMKRTIMDNDSPTEGQQRLCSSRNSEDIVEEEQERIRHKRLSCVIS